MTFNPNITQLEMIAELSNAKASLATIAKACGTTPEAFKTWRQRLQAATAALQPMPPPMKPLPIKHEGRVRSWIETAS